MEDEFLELRDSKSGRVFLFDNPEAIAALEFLRELNSETTSAMLESFVARFPHESDDNIAFLISKFALEQIKIIKSIRQVEALKMQHAMQQTMLSMLTTDRRPRNQRCRIPKAKVPHIDYSILAMNLSRQVRLDWMTAVSEKNLSPEALRYLRIQIRSIKTIYTDNKEAERAYRKMQSFIANLRAAIRRFKSAELKKLVTIKSNSQGDRQQRKNIKEAPAFNRRSLLLKQIGAICALNESHFIMRLSNNKLDRLLMVLRALNGKQDAHSKLLAMPGLELALSNQSPLIHAVIRCDLNEMLRLIDNKPMQISEENQITDIRWEEYQFPVGTTLRLIIGSNASKKVYLITALQSIATNVILVGADNLREVQAATESSDIIILATGFVSHKTSIITKGRDNVILIGQANPASIVRDVIKSCLLRGVPLTRKS